MMEREAAWMVTVGFMETGQGLPITSTSPTHCHSCWETRTHRHTHTQTRRNTKAAGPIHNRRLLVRELPNLHPLKVKGFH